MVIYMLKLNLYKILFTNNIKNSIITIIKKLYIIYIYIQDKIKFK